MTQSDFIKLKCGDSVLTLYKGKVVPGIINSIYDKGHQKRSVILDVKKSEKPILRHMYAIYLMEV